MIKNESHNKKNYTTRYFNVNKYILFYLTFDNRVLRTICGPVYDDVANCWRRRKNRELREMTKIPVITSYIKGQRLKWFGHVKRREATNKVRATLDWQPKGKRPKGRPKKRRIDGIKQDLQMMEVTD